MMYLSVRPAGSAPAPLPPAMLEQATITQEAPPARDRVCMTPANAPVAPRPAGRPASHRWRLRIAVPAIFPTWDTLLRLVGVLRAGGKHRSGPATREELSHLFERELADFARARPKRRR